jgi:hypothetical protein
MAEKIRGGHYGINSNEFSAPSSSILWPFILAPLSGFSHNEYFPLIINIIAAVGTVFLFWKILINSIHTDDIYLKTKAIYFLLVLLVIGTNTIGLIFSGMEHSLQLLFVVTIVYGLILEIENKRVMPWLIAAILVAPLIRYENLAVSLAAVLYIFLRRYYKLSVLLAVLLILLIGSFSIFLLQLGLGPLPTSVVVKTLGFSSSVGKYILKNLLMYGLLDSRGIVLSCGLLCLVSFLLFSKQQKEKRLLAGTISFSIVLHLLAGRYGMYNRMEIYVWSVTVLTLLYLSKQTLSGLFIGNRANINLIKVIAIAGLAVFVTCEQYIYDLFTIPLASNNIYEQHYQMHRFAVEYYDKPVAVSDLGYVAYKNNNYVLDLVGLASIEALTYRKNSSSNNWMNDLAKAKNVQLAMIWNNWSNSAPANWIKIGELYLGRKKITPASQAVAFYALNDDAYKVILGKMQSFQKTLPKGVEFIFVNNKTN